MDGDIPETVHAPGLALIASEHRYPNDDPQFVHRNAATADNVSAVARRQDVPAVYQGGAAEVPLPGSPIAREVPLQRSHERILAVWHRITADDPRLDAAAFILGERGQRRHQGQRRRDQNPQTPQSAPMSGQTCSSFHTRFPPLQRIPASINPNHNLLYLGLTLGLRLTPGLLTVGRLA